MGFWDREVEHNGFDDMFDYNRDGRIDAGEEAAELDYIDRMSSDEDCWDDDEDDF